jgi:DmsE family decaheme c-type cytochrome
LFGELNCVKNMAGAAWLSGAESPVLNFDMGHGMSGKTKRALDVLHVLMSGHLLEAPARRQIAKRAISALVRAPRVIIAGAFLLSQPAGAATSLQAPAPVVGSFADFQHFIQTQGSAAQSRTGNRRDDYAVLATYVQTADNLSASSPRVVSDGVAAGGSKAGSSTASDDYSVLSNFVEGQGAGPQSGKAPNDAVHAKALGSAAALGEAPADSIHSAFKGAAKTGSDAYSALSAFADAPADAGKQIVTANDAAAPAKHGGSLPAKKLEGGSATYVGSQACVKCHKGQAASFAQTLHGSIFLKQPRNAKEREGCEGCHGPASLHIAAKQGDNGAEGDIISFRKDSPRPSEERNAICLTCHEKGDRNYWSGGPHEMRGLACTNCHQIMEKVSVKHQLIKSTESETCFQCHKDIRAKLANNSHMPLASGAMTCSSCHNPHGSATDKLLREASVNETCYKCHADKRGPFLWEHEPVRDSCLNCHDAHGSTNEYMLKVQRPRLCSQCHAGGVGHGTPGNPTTVQAINRSCQNCHTKVHGSNSPAGALFQR